MHAYVRSIKCDTCNRKLSPGYSSHDENNSAIIFLSGFIRKYDCDNCKRLFTGCPICGAVLPRLYATLSYCTAFINHARLVHKINTNFVIMGDGIYVKNLSDGLLVYISKILSSLPQLLLLQTDIHLDDAGIRKHLYKTNPYIMGAEELQLAMDYLYTLEYKCFICDAEYDSLPSKDVITEHLISCFARVLACGIGDTTSLRMRTCPINYIFFTSLIN